jgi:hypothetical protein
MNKVKVIGSVGGNNAHEKFLETPEGLLDWPVSAEEAEQLFGELVNPEDFGGVANEGA